MNPRSGTRLSDTGRRSLGLGLWWLAIRPRTLSLSAIPVLVGSALAWSEGAAIAWPPLVVALLCALLIQAGTNLFNDVGDALRGNDGPTRLGPVRVTAAGLATPGQVRRAALATFLAALLGGLYLVWYGGWPILLIGLASLLAGWAYSGGPRPLSYTAWGEVFVMGFFGLVAVAGSHFLQSDGFSAPALVTGLALGCHAAAVLLVNNVRDLEADRRAGRSTLASVVGSHAARRLYAGLMLTNQGPKVLEYNVRLGDPECQPLLMRLKSDLVDILDAVVDGDLKRIDEPVWDERPAVCVVMASEGYPGDYTTGHEIRGLAEAAAVPDVKVFHAGTKMQGDRVVTAGGRVLGVTAMGSSVSAAKLQAYTAVKAIRWQGAWCRKDISDKALALDSK